MSKITLEEAGWRGGLEFAVARGQAKLSDESPIYKNRWVEFIDIHRGNDGEINVVVFVNPTKRYLKLKHVTEIKLPPEQLMKLMEEKRTP